MSSQDRTRGRRTPLILAILVAAALALGAFLIWSRVQPDPLDDDVLAYRLKWLANPGFVGDLYADAYGVFRERGLNVRVEPGGPERDSMVALGAGQARFAVASSDQVLRALYGGVDVLVIAQIYQTDPVQWVYRSADASFETAADLTGRRIGVTVGDNDETIMRTFLSVNHVDAQDVTLVPVRFDFAPFLNNTVDLFPVYRNTQGVELRRMLSENDEPVGYFQTQRPRSINIVPNSIVTTSRLARENPRLVCRFVDAALIGWERAMDEDELGRAIRAVRYAQRGVNDELPSEERDSLGEQVEATTSLVTLRYGEPVQLGALDTEGWMATERLLLDAGMLDDASGARPAIIGIEGYLDARFVGRHHGAGCDDL